ncbi:neural cell adhesion molecule 1-A-like [Polyodon spathula]|uniref:neural cell adhesion molecule 1-A-like n=1 Tax=Polyodon spathula TaxID=7913 RepID=UPI001B7E5D69|nr:neural cell adhesion molecule 1-A-like [Polyodon spathula]
MKSMLVFIWGLLLVITTETRVEIMPSLGYIELNESKVFVCVVEGAVQEMKWLHPSGKEIRDREDERLQVEQADKIVSKLVIRDAQLQDAGRYQCVCRFDESYAETAAVTVTVVQKPTFLNPKTYHEFLEGSEAFVPCDVTGIPQPLVTWKHKGRDVMHTEDGRFLLTAQGLLIQGVRGSDQGLYRCEGRIVDRGEVQSLDISVVVNVPPTVRIREGKVNVTAGSGVNVSLACLVNGHPHPYISWIRDGGPVVAEPGRFGFNSDQSVLTIYAVEKADEGQYTCTATNKINSSRDDVTLHVTANQTEEEVPSPHSTGHTVQATGGQAATVGTLDLMKAQRKEQLAVLQSLAAQQEILVRRVAEIGAEISQLTATLLPVLHSLSPPEKAHD